MNKAEKRPSRWLLSDWAGLFLPLGSAVFAVVVVVFAVVSQCWWWWRVFAPTSLGRQEVQESRGWVGIQRTSHLCLYTAGQWPFFPSLEFS